MPGAAEAHGIGARYDLPVPLWLYLYAGGGVVLLSFFMVALFVGRAGSAGDRSLDLGWPSGLIGSARVVGGVVGVITLGAVIWAGFLGRQVATLNISEYLVWIIFWAGLVVVSGLVGNLYALVNPWAALYDLTTLGRGGRPWTPPLRLPDGLGVWPAAGLLLGFTWLELASGRASRPVTLAVAASAYTVLTLWGMFVFGRDQWLRQVDPFSVLFGLIGMLSPVALVNRDSSACRQCSGQCLPERSECSNCAECLRRSEDRALVLRPWGVGLLEPIRGGWDRVTFVVLTLSTLAFDGFEATPLYADLGSAAAPLYEPWGEAGLVMFRTAGLLALSLLFLLVYVLAAVAVRECAALVSSARRPMREVALPFALSLVPIALVYNAAHNYGYLVIQSQGLIPRLSDPLGHGWNLFGTATYQPNFSLASAALVWYTQVILIVLGHVVAVYVAHLRALTIFPRSREALVSQYPLLVLMVGYTMISLWILAQPIVVLR